VLKRKQLVLSLVVVVMAVACSNEVKKKDVPSGQQSFDCAALSAGDKYLCLSEALKGIETPAVAAVACADDPTSLACGKSRFFYDGYGGFVYPAPVLDFFNDFYAIYVDKFYTAYKNNTQPLPNARHFGQLYGLIYNDPSDAKTLEAIDADANPIGIVDGGVLTVAGTSIQYESESCALCHFNHARDGFYRYGTAHADLKYGALKIAMTRFVHYVDGGRYTTLNTDCLGKGVDIDTLEEPKKSECKAYTAFLASSPNATLLEFWKAQLTDAQRTALLEQMKAAVPGAASATDAVEQLMGPMTDQQVIDIAQWDGTGSLGGGVNTSRMDRFYGNVTTLAGVASRPIDDGVHAPVKIPHLGGLVSDGATDNSGHFLASGVVSSLEHYVRLHVALVGGENTDVNTKVQNADLTGLMAFLHTLKLPSLDIDLASHTAAEQAQIAEGETAFNARCAGCHNSPDSTQNELVDYTQTVGTDYSYALMLGGEVATPTPTDLTPDDTWNVAVGGLKTPPLKGLWAYNGYLHNAMVYSLENLFCLYPAVRPLLDTTSTEGGLVFKAPFFDSGHSQTCYTFDSNGARVDIDIAERKAMIAYLKTL